MNVSDALRRTLELIETSESSAYSTHTIEEMARSLREALDALESKTSMDISNLRILFAPTGSIQETSLDNGWGEEFVALSEAVDSFLRTEERGMGK